jgi:hypothetical protein
MAEFNIPSLHYSDSATLQPFVFPPVQPSKIATAVA